MTCNSQVFLVQYYGNMVAVSFLKVPKHHLALAAHDLMSLTETFLCFCVANADFRSDMLILMGKFNPSVYFVVSYCEKSSSDNMDKTKYTNPLISIPLHCLSEGKLMTGHVQVYSLDKYCNCKSFVTVAHANPNATYVCSDDTTEHTVIAGCHRQVSGWRCSHSCSTVVL